MQRPLRFVSVIVPVVIAACSDAGDGDLFEASKGLSVGGSSNASGSTAGPSGGRADSNGGSAASSGGKSAATGGAPHPGGGGTAAGTAGATEPLGGNASGGSNASSGGSKSSPGGSASGGGATAGGSPGAGGKVDPTGGSQAAKGGSVASGGGPIASGGSFAGNDCQQARAALNEALEAAQACNPGAEKQCRGFVQGECCPVAVNDPDSEATAEFTAARAKWEKTCGGAVCLAVLCIEPTVAACDSQGSGPGHCVTGSDFSL